MSSRRSGSRGGLGLGAGIDVVLEPILGCGCALDLRIRVGGVVEHLMAPADPIYLDVGQAGEGRTIDIVLQTESTQAFAVHLALVADDARRFASGPEVATPAGYADRWRQRRGR